MNDEVIITPKSHNSGWIIQSDGYFKNHIAERLRIDGIPKEAVENIFQNVTEILSNCPNPNIDNPDAKTGIVIGKVQSGKTSNFISLIALGFDNQYPISIVLGGNTLPLLEQNAKRIKTYFSGIPFEKLVILTTKENSSLLNPKTIRNFIDEGRKIIIVGLKHHGHINKIAKMFENSDISNIPTLIIDDEGDQATLKANTRRLTATYSSALRIKNNILRHCFISITATPQANILIDTIDALSPDFGNLVYPGEGYCGLGTFHGINEDIYIKDIVNDSEDSLLDDNGIPPSFNEALSAFFMGRAIRIYRGDDNYHSMLIHPSQLKIDHGVVVNKVQKQLDNWIQRARTKLLGFDDISYITLQTHLKKAYDGFVADGVRVPLFRELEKIVLDEISKCPPVFKCNSDDDQSENAKLYKCSIFVGGNMLERGITLTGLAITYIIRRARGVANVDNTEQRARWFGYKSRYIDVCRVYTTRNIKDDFSAIYDHDGDLWATIEEARMSGIQFKDISRVFRLANNMLRLTRPNIAKTERLGYSEWIKQNRLVFQKNVSDQNDYIINSYKEQHAINIEILSFSKVQTHSILKDVSYDEVCINLLSRLIFPDDSVSNNQFEKIRIALNKSNIIDPKVDVLWMREGVHEERTLRTDGTINNIFQGSNKETGDLQYYPGDRYLDKNDKMQLQIHYIRPKNMAGIDYHIAAIALYVPSNFNDEINKFVIKQN